MGGHFRSSVWDPLHISSQIIAIQTLYYMSLGAWITIMDFIVGSNRSLDQMFSYPTLSFQDINGRLIMGGFVFNSLTCALGLWYIVKRTKLCLDFTATAHILHFLICWFYNSSFPSTLSWWLVNVICLIIMTVLGEFLCMRTEMKAIPVSMGPRVDL